MSHPKRKLFVTLSILPFIVGAFLLLSLWTPVSGSEHHTLIRSSCSSTLYPDVCFSAISSSSVPSWEMKTPKDVIRVALEHTVLSTQHNYFNIKKKLASRALLTVRERTALHDCLNMVDQSLDELRATLHDLQDYPNTNRSIAQYADDLQTLLSAAMTNQESCLDGFSHDRGDKKVRQSLLTGQMHVFRMCSNSLAMIKNMTDTDMAERRSILEIKEHKLPGRELGAEEEGNTRGWPKWLSAGNRRLLQATTVTPDITVAADGSGNYRTVAAAVAAAPEGSTRRFIIRIKAGVYRENVEIPKKKTNLMFVGDGRTTTIITGSRNVVDGSTTFNSATVERKKNLK
ncbi:hypothetical protein CRG98_018373 [Punica granatum]|uniref:Pectinesterase n=1 Tax=Punica granatum TaxID=22663 RepID=A0A2I0JY55_PUNGR|nr:hypothetical protein CRG98_018373 [Punica granatum]